jgi:molecular chaperone HtpG
MAAPVTSSPVEHEELVFAPAIFILADDLYPRKLEIVREYIQNASDALDDFAPIADYIGDQADPQIKISIQGRSLLIYDNGIGMDHQEIKKLKRIAYSEKKEGERAGYKGIGRLAGLAVAEKLTISSTSYGDPKLHKFELRVKACRDDVAEKKQKGITEYATVVINRHTTISSLDVDPKEHYTLVELRDIDEKHPEILNPAHLREFVGEMAPVGFDPEFPHGKAISEKLVKQLPDYSPKTIWLANTETGDRMQVYKPYSNAMSLAEPEFIEIEDPKGDLVAFCWAAPMGKEMLQKVRPIGNRFTVPGDTPERRKRLAGLVYKLFGFSIGDRNLPTNTLWAKDVTRALWFTGEIHIVDKDVKPSTDRANFVDNVARARLYEAAKKVPKRLNALAQDISDNRQAFDKAAEWEVRFRDLEKRLKNGGLERAELGTRRRELYEGLQTLKRKCKDKDIEAYVRRTTKKGHELERRLDEVKVRKSKTDHVNDLARELEMTTQARSVYRIIMEVLEQHFENDKDTYYALSEEITKALKKRY